MKSYADKNRSPRQFQLGDSVFLKLQPYAQSSVANRPFPKLAFKYFGPSKVLAKIGNAAYKQVLPTHTQIHLVFHVSPLKHSVPDNTPVFSEIPAFPTLDRADVVPQLILHRRLVKKKGILLSPKCRSNGVASLQRCQPGKTTTSSRRDFHLHQPGL